jgi:hypothetical protein
MKIHKIPTRSGISAETDDVLAASATTSLTSGGSELSSGFDLVSITFRLGGDWSDLPVFPAWGRFYESVSAVNYC